MRLSFQDRNLRLVLASPGVALARGFAPRTALLTDEAFTTAHRLRASSMIAQPDEFASQLGHHARGA